MKIYLIRHGQTKGNSQGRYVGRTDEPLMSGEREKLNQDAPFAVKAGQAYELYVSPMLRCRETASILFPGKEQTIIEAFRECDFGEFEYKTYKELSGNPAYQRFIDSGGSCGFPGGESVEAFRSRCAGAFERLITRHRKRDTEIVLVVHGGTIMAILDRFSSPHKDYYAWQTGNGDGYTAEASCDRESGGLVLQDIVALRG